MAVSLNGSMIPARGPRGEPVEDDSFLVLFNSGGQPCPFIIPKALPRDGWTLELDTAMGHREGEEYTAGDRVDVASWSVVLLRRPKGTLA